MDRRETVRMLTRKGIIVTPEVLERAERLGLDRAVGAEAKASSKTKLSVLIRKTELVEMMSTNDFTTYYNNRYSGLKDILLKKMDAVSINKAAEGVSGVSVIGMVRERLPGGFRLEDATGEIDVVSGDVVNDDDVVGVNGVVKEGRLFQKELVWPDIPPTNKPAFPDTTLLLTTFLDDDLRGVFDEFSLIFIYGKAGADADDPRVIHGLPNPCFATIKKDGKEFTVLIYKPRDRIIPEQAAGYLKRRHLLPDRKHICSREDPYLIDHVPNLFWVISGQRHVGQYNGVALVMSMEHDAVTFDLGTGKAGFACSTPGRAGEAVA
jgi:DNA polymerase II small subunit/DNA polymerase delta subunit B